MGRVEVVRHPSYPLSRRVVVRPYMNIYALDPKGGWSLRHPTSVMCVRMHLYTWSKQPLGGLSSRMLYIDFSVLSWCTLSADAVRVDGARPVGSRRARDFFELVPPRGQRCTYDSAASVEIASVLLVERDFVARSLLL